jgi:hypothetical protein
MLNRRREGLTGLLDDGRNNNRGHAQLRWRNRNSSLVAHEATSIHQDRTRNQKLYRRGEPDPVAHLGPIGSQQERQQPGGGGEQR